MSYPTMSQSEFYGYLLECRNYLELAGEIPFDDCVEILDEAVFSNANPAILTPLLWRFPAWEVYETVISTVITANPGQSGYYLPTPDEFLEGVTLLHNNH